MSISAPAHHPLSQRMANPPQEAKKTEYTPSPAPLLRTAEQSYLVGLATLVKRPPEDPDVGSLTAQLIRNLETHLGPDQPFRTGFVCLLGSLPSPERQKDPITLKLRLGSGNLGYGGKIYVTASSGITGSCKRYSRAYELIFNQLNGFLSMPKGCEDDPRNWNPASLREWKAVMKFCPKPGMAHCHDLFLYQSPKKPGRERVGMVFDCFDADLQMIYPIRREEDLFVVLRNCAQSLLKLHQSGVVHRDIKPENFGVNVTGWKVRILDPGFACFAGEPLMPCGSPPYLAPEVFSYSILHSKSPCMPPPSLPAQDVWSFGVMMYAFATNTPPSFQAILVDHLKKKTEPDFSTLSSLIEEEISKRRDLSASMKTLLKGMFRISPSERFSMKAVLELMDQPDFSVRTKP